MESPGPQSPIQQWLDLTERISICGRLLRSVLDGRLQASSLGASQFSILWACYGAAAGAGQSALADSLAVSPAHVSGLVEQLRVRGLLQSRRPASDRRRQLWRLTVAGRAIVEAVLADLRDWAEGLEGRVPAADAQVLHHLLEQLNGALAAQPAGAEASDQRKGAA